VIILSHEQKEGTGRGRRLKFSRTMHCITLTNTHGTLSFRTSRTLIQQNLKKKMFTVTINAFIDITAYIEIH